MSIRRAVLVALAPLALSCGRASAPPPAATRSSTPPPAAAPASGVVAEVNGTSIQASELEERVHNRLASLRQQEYDLRRQALEEIIAERLVAAEATKRGISAEKLLAQEVDKKVTLPDEKQLDTIYEQNKLRFGSAPKKEAVARIRDILTQRAVSERRSVFEKELRRAASVNVRLDPPRTDVQIPAGAPATGPKDAPVTIVEFTDYQCPYCHSSQRTIDEVLSRYSGKVRLVHLDFPLDIHPEAVSAARAARCAGEQGKFWEFHRSLMTQNGSMDEDDLKGRAKKLELKESSFGTCLASARHDEAIQAELHQGTELGVNGTPAYFVNGRMLSGSQPVEAFVDVIDAELNPAPGGSGGERR
jgi:protein-disulfide isomerase